MQDTEENKNVGRPALFATPEALQEKIDEYFAEGGTDRVFVCGSGSNKYDVTVTIYTITGLCLFCGFESRQSFYDYEDRPEFSYTVKRARLQIEQMYEENLQYGNTTGSIFALKNFGWKDQQGIDHTTGGQPFAVKPYDFIADKDSE
jgi:hypothetical protein